LSLARVTWLFMPLRPATGVCVLAISLYCSGCSLLFVTAPPKPPPVEPSARAEVSCTSGKAAPVLDTVFATLEVARTALAAAAPDSTYQNAPISRGADIALGLGFTALFLGSAVYGFTQTSQCKALKGPEPRRPEEHAPSDEPAQESARLRFAPIHEF
jgi:hypothetical protein